MNSLEHQRGGVVRPLVITEGSWRRVPLAIANQQWTLRINIWHYESTFAITN